MPRISDYTVVRDGAFDLDPNDSSQFQFDLNSDAHRSRGVLMFRMHAHSGPSQLSYSVSINDSEVFSYPFGLETETCQTVNEVINEGVLKAGGNLVPNHNEIRFSASGNAGRITISDVVVLFQRDI